MGIEANGVRLKLQLGSALPASSKPEVDLRSVPLRCCKCLFLVGPALRKALHRRHTLPLFRRDMALVVLSEACPSTSLTATSGTSPLASA